MLYPRLSSAVPRRPVAFVGFDGKKRTTPATGTQLLLRDGFGTSLSALFIASPATSTASALLTRNVSCTVGKSAVSMVLAPKAASFTFTGELDAGGVGGLGCCRGVAPRCSCLACCLPSCRPRALASTQLPPLPPRFALPPPVTVNGKKATAAAPVVLGPAATLKLSATGLVTISVGTMQLRVTQRSSAAAPLVRGRELRVRWAEGVLRHSGRTTTPPPFPPPSPPLAPGRQVAGGGGGGHQAAQGPPHGGAGSDLPASQAPLCAGGHGRGRPCVTCVCYAPVGSTPHLTLMTPD